MFIRSILVSYILSKIQHDTGTGAGIQYNYSNIII